MNLKVIAKLYPHYVQSKSKGKEYSARCFPATQSSSIIHFERESLLLRCDGKMRAIIIIYYYSQATLQHCLNYYVNLDVNTLFITCYILRTCLFTSNRTLDPISSGMQQLQWHKK